MPSLAFHPAQQAPKSAKELLLGGQEPTDLDELRRPTAGGGFGIGSCPFFS